MLRLARPNERLDLEELQHRSSRALPEYRDQLEADPEAIDLPLSQVVRGEVSVAESVDGIAGFAVVIIDGDAAEIDGLFVEPHLWRRGVGAALIEAATHDARRAGLEPDSRRSAGSVSQILREAQEFTAEGGVETRFGPAVRMSR